MTDTIKLFVGCAPNGEDAESQMVLEYTARTKSSLPIDIVWMKISEDGYWSGWNSSQWSTPFSGFRWGIPEYCGFEGQAIYMDSDMIIQADLAELWNAPWEDRAVLQSKGGWRFCVSKWNCERARDHLMPVARMRNIAESHSRYCNYFASHPQLIQQFDRRWNNYDGENDPLDEIKILHYTSMNHQPHLKYAIPRLKENNQSHWFDGEIQTHWRKDVIELFDKYYQEAILSGGMSPDDYTPEKFISYKKLSQKNYKNAHEFVKYSGE